MLSKKDVQHVARLARLGLSEKEREKMQKDLSSILDYIEKLKEVNISKVNLYLEGDKSGNVMREDEVVSDENKADKTKKLIDLAPEERNRYIKVKQVFE